MIFPAAQRRAFEQKLFFCECLTCLPSRDPHKKSDDVTDAEERIRRGLLGFEDGGPRYTNLVDDGEYVGIFDRPVRVGSSILLCGRREGQFPNQCMIGPDWPCSVLVYTAIIGAHVIVLWLASPCLGWVPLILGICGFLLLMYIYSAVACTNPGMVLKPAPPNYGLDLGIPRSVHPETGNPVDLDLEEGKEPVTVTETETEVDTDVTTSLRNAENGDKDDTPSDSEKSTYSEDSGTGTSVHSATANLLSDDDQGRDEADRAQEGTSLPIPSTPPGAAAHFMIESISGNTINTIGAVTAERTIMCGSCQFERPIRARHCGFCGACIEGLDHHCPWSGKCIGQNNMKAFHRFVALVCFEIYFIGGIFIYYVAACNYDALPTGEGI